MENYEPAMSFGEETAESYDDEPRGDEEAAVSFLEQLAGGGPALELAIGTGRIALPLAARGIRVDGIDISPAMVARLREKPGGDQISVLYRVYDDRYVHAESVGVDEVWFDVGRHDPVAQWHEETHVRLTNEGVRLFPIVQRYTWPSELDLMARIAGLRLKERWDGWNREPFTSTGNVVSVYGR